MDVRGITVLFVGGAREFCLEEHLDLLWCILGNLSVLLEEPGCAADHSPPPPSGAKVENEWSCTSTPP